MDDNTFDKCKVSIRERVKFIRSFYGSQPSTKRTGLVSSARTVHVLAARHLDEIRDGLEDDDSLFWYLRYLESVSRLSVTFQDAVKDGTLTLRHGPSRAPLRPHDIQSWLETDIVSARPDVNLFPDCAEWDTWFEKWPDGWLHPPSLVTLEDAEAWVKSAGITTAAELRELLGLDAQVKPAEPPPAPAATVKPVPRFEAQDAEILAAIRANGNDPLSLPETPPGKSGIKAVIKGKLIGRSNLFPMNGSQFDKAWVRLRASGQIAD